MPCHVCVSRPGDLTVFDQGCFHAAFGGEAGRRMCAAVFYLLPRNADEEEMLDLVPNAVRTSRLACQVVLDDRIGSIGVVVPTGG